MNLNLVSIIVPCRNECENIEKFVADALNQCTADWRVELIVADGMSDDGTRERLQAIAEVEHRLRWIDNPGRIVSTGLNLAIATAGGEILVRMDVHTRYAPDYVLQCVRALEISQATCVGGPWLAEGQTTLQKAIAAAFQSRIGSGGAASRETTFSGWVDTVYLGAWRRTDLLRLGGFDETLVRNQDDELALRIHREGGRVWQSSEIRSIYEPRASLMALYRQFKQYGYWKIPVIRKHRIPASPRHLAPFAFFVTLAMLALFSLIWTPIAVAFCGLVLVYLGALIAGTPSRPTAHRPVALRLLTIAAVATIHFGYAIGFGRAIWDFFVLRKGGRQTMMQLTR